MLYEYGERTASALYYFATRRVPGAFKKLYKTEDIIPWVEEVGRSDGADENHFLTLAADNRQETDAAPVKGQESTAPMESPRQ